MGHAQAKYVEQEKPSLNAAVGFNTEDVTLEHWVRTLKRRGYESCSRTGIKGQVKYRGSRPQGLSGDPGSNWWADTFLGCNPGVSRLFIFMTFNSISRGGYCQASSLQSSVKSAESAVYLLSSAFRLKGRCLAALTKGNEERVGETACRRPGEIGDRGK